MSASDNDHPFSQEQLLALAADFDVAVDALAGSVLPASRASGEARQGRGEAPLGNKRKNVGGQVGPNQQALAEAAALKKRTRQLLREPAADQRTAASIYRSMVPEGEKAAGRGVCLCGWTKITGQKIELHRADGKDGARAFYKGLSKCGLRWVCPICTRAASERARESLNDALAAARDSGFVPVLVTLTARHYARMPLADFWQCLSIAEKQLKDVQAWRRMKSRNGPMVGFAKAVEATHGRNGWHPHFHLLMVMRADSEAEAIEEVQWIREAWLEQLEGVGLDGTSPAAVRRAFDVQGAAEAGSYVTKWGAAEELALSGAKTGRGGGRTPWQLLRDVRTAEAERDRRQAAALWWEFVQVFKGVHQLRLSPSLKALIAKHKEDYPPAEEEDRPEAQPVFGFTDLDWEVGRWRRTMMREAAEDAPAELAREAVLAALLSGRCDKDDLATPDDPGLLVEDDDGRCAADTPPPPTGCTSLKRRSARAGLAAVGANDTVEDRPYDQLYHDVLQDRPEGVQHRISDVGVVLMPAKSPDLSDRAAYFVTT